jgi:hypothetical protein
VSVFTFQVKQTSSGRHYCKVIKAGQVIHIVRGNYRSGEEAKAAARQALSLAFQLKRVL